MRELEAGDDVADGVDAVDVGAAALVGEHEAALHRDALLLVAEAVGGGAATDRDQQQLGLDDVAALDGHGDAGVGVLDALERRAGAEVDLALAEGPLEGLGGRLVLDRDEPGERLDDGDLGAEAGPHAGELAADDAAAEHDHRRGHAVEAQGVLGGEHPLAVDLEAGQGLGVGAGGEHDVAARVGRVADGDGARSGEPALALDHGDAARLDQPGEALEEPGDDPVLVGVDAGHVDAVEGGVDAELRGLAGRVGDLGGVQQRLGRDAADVEAGAAEIALLDQSHRQPELRRPECAGVSARARPEDEYVEVALRHLMPSALARWIGPHLCTLREPVHTGSLRAGTAQCRHGTLRPIPSLRPHATSCP